jgi:pimeloyl-ACP methyl ester carboxylesterase
MAFSVSRHHVEVGGRRVHYLRAGQGPAVVLLHESPRSGAALLPLMRQAPAGVTVLALDTPGNGLSQPLPQASPTAFDYGDALAETLAALGIARAAVYGRHSGAAFGMALAARHPQRVSGLVLDGVSAFTAAEQAQWLEPYLPPFVPASDGSHMAWLWSRVRDQALFFPWHEARMARRLWQPLPTPAALHAVALDLLSAGDAYRVPYRAAFTFDPAPVLLHLQMPTAVAARDSDVLRPHQARLPPPNALPPHVRLHRLPDDRATVGARVWQWLAAGACGLADAPPAQDAALPSERLGDTLVGAPGRRTHLRGATGGSGRPRIWLHASPGGARGMDRQMERHAGRDLERHVGHRFGHRFGHHFGPSPVFAFDLPHHGESDPWCCEPEELIDHLQMLVGSLGLGDAELHGEGLGAAVAAALAQRLPRATAPALSASALGSASVPAPSPAPSTLPEYCVPRDDGGHLLAAWLHARDEAVLGGWWARANPARFDCGDAIDLVTVQARALEFLKEGEGAGAMRAMWLRRHAGLRAAS